MQPSTTNRTFATLENLPTLRHGFIGRVAGVDVEAPREDAILRLAVHHGMILKPLLPFEAVPMCFAEQVHGNRVAVVEAADCSPIPRSDALVTGARYLPLGIYVADCCPVYLVDPSLLVLGMVHSGKRGTEAGVVTATIDVMVARFGCKPRNILAQLGPCIRPPNYEIDFAAEIRAQCARAGLIQISDCGEDTSVDSDAYYSYRREQGRTGRMLAWACFA